MVLGFELTTFQTQVSSHNHKTKAPANIVLLLEIPENKWDIACELAHLILFDLFPGLPAAGGQFLQTCFARRSWAPTKQFLDGRDRLHPRTGCCEAVLPVL